MYLYTMHTIVIFNHDIFVLYMSFLLHNLTMSQCLNISRLSLADYIHLAAIGVKTVLLGSTISESVICTILKLKGNFAPSHTVNYSDLVQTWQLSPMGQRLRY